MDNLNSRETGQNDSPMRRLIAHIFKGRDQAAPAPAPAPSMPMPPTDQMADEMDLARRNMIGMQNAQQQQSAQPQAAPEMAMYGMPITEGQNANIGDDSRERALAMIQALRNGGALS
jgi:hypothetical protein